MKSPLAQWDALGRATSRPHLARSLDAHAEVLGVAAEGTVVGGDQQLSLAARSGALQVTGLIGDADVISYTGDTFGGHLVTVFPDDGVNSELTVWGSG